MVKICVMNANTFMHAVYKIWRQHVHACSVQDMALTRSCMQCTRYGANTFIHAVYKIWRPHVHACSVQDMAPTRSCMQCTRYGANTFMHAVHKIWRQHVRAPYLGQHVRAPTQYALKLLISSSITVSDLKMGNWFYVESLFVSNLKLIFVTFVAMMLFDKLRCLTQILTHVNVIGWCKVYSNGAK